MSLSSYVKETEVRATIKELRPDISRNIAAPLLVEPRSRRAPLVGTAFDYLFRFEMQRRVPHAKTQRWVAEHAAMLVRHANIRGGELQVMIPGGGPSLYVRPPGGYARTARKIEKLVEHAREAVEEHASRKDVDPAQITLLAEHALRLAKLDLVFRQGLLDMSFTDAASEDVEDLVGLLQVVPWQQFTTHGPVLLNPTFIYAAGAVGGADADLIAGDLLVDIKTTKDDKLKAEYFDQLFGYFLLSRRHRKRARRFPRIERVGIYLARRGHLLLIHTDVWTTHPDFKRIEKWFFKHALATHR